jgi:hypothetical protein
MKRRKDEKDMIGRKRMKKREDEYFVILYYTYNEVSITTEMPQPHRKVF